MDRNILSRPAKDRPRWAYKAGSGLTSVLLRPTGSSSEEVGKQIKFYTRVANSTLQRLRGTDLRAVVVSQTRFSTRLSANWDMLCDDPPRRAATRRRWNVKQTHSYSSRWDEGGERRYGGKCGGNADVAEWLWCCCMHPWAGKVGAEWRMWRPMEQS